MNDETETLIERPYQEIVDDILIAIIGGVVNEPIIFDVKSDLYPLAEQARSCRRLGKSLYVLRLHFGRTGRHGSREQPGAGHGDDQSHTR